MDDSQEQRAAAPQLEAPAESASSRLGVAARDPDELLIRPRRGWQLIDFRELWRYRELLYVLVWRDVKVRYKQAALGAAWAVLQPLAAMIVFSLFFSRLADGGPGDLPYPLFVFAGLLPWTFFAGAVSGASQSIVGGQQLITKVYFPRLLIPMAAAGHSLVDFAISCSLLGVLLIYYVIRGSAHLPGWGLLMLPVVVLVLFAAAIGVGTFLAALTTAYRDFRHVVPFMVQMWMFATPSIYLQASTELSSTWRALLPLNPVYGLIAAFRAATLGVSLDWYSLTVSATVSLSLLLLGSLYFRRVERIFADVI
jgi:lipopolysaccharide transport system permease protein